MWAFYFKMRGVPLRDKNGAFGTLTPFMCKKQHLWLIFFGKKRVLKQLRSNNWRGLKIDAVVHCGEGNLNESVDLVFPPTEGQFGKGRSDCGPTFMTRRIFVWWLFFGDRRLMCFSRVEWIRTWISWISFPPCTMRLRGLKPHMQDNRLADPI